MNKAGNRISVSRDERGVGQDFGRDHVRPVKRFRAPPRTRKGRAMDDRINTLGDPRDRFAVERSPNAIIDPSASSFASHSLFRPCAATWAPSARSARTSAPPRNPSRPSPKSFFRRVPTWA